jgi:hypothetical protein
MAKEMIVTQKTKKELRKWQKDIEDLDNYRPYITVRKVNTIGRRHWGFCYLQQRDEHLLSDGEFRTKTKLMWQPGTCRILEQYALDINETLDIAVEKNYIHPRNWKTFEAYVMTTDFVVHRYDKNNPSEIVITAYTFKYWDQIYKKLEDGTVVKKKMRTWQKFAIEQEYWRRRGVDYRVVTERDATKEEFWNIRLSEQARDFEVPKEEILIFIEHFIEAWQNRFRALLEQHIATVSKLMDISPVRAKKLFFYATLHKLLPVKNDQCIRLFRPVELDLS